MPEFARWTAVACLLALLAQCLVWDLSLAPRPSGVAWLLLKLLPLLAALRGMLHGRRYTFQWMSLAVWLYFTEGIVRATSDTGMPAVIGWIETVLALALFAACVKFARDTAPSRRQRQEGA